jgi:inward rectifier potassium channel
MSEQIKDPGIGQKWNARTERIMDKEGNFNVRSTGFNFRRTHPFQYLINISWFKFYFILLCGFISVTLIYTVIYLCIGTDVIKVSGNLTPMTSFWRCLFFSVQTITTVGYGNFYPYNYATNAVASIEAMTGLLGFAVVTGLVYGRFSKPTSKIAYSKNAIIAPYNNGNALMLRVVNLRDSLMTEVHADILYTCIYKGEDQFIRNYFQLQLERNTVIYLPLTWTLVHPIDENSPLFGKSIDELKAIDSEILVKLKGHDEGFGEEVHSRNSYLIDEVIWGASFISAFHVDENGKVVLDFDKISAYEDAELNNELRK